MLNRTTKPPYQPGLVFIQDINEFALTTEDILKIKVPKHTIYLNPLYTSSREADAVNELRHEYRHKLNEYNTIVSKVAQYEETLQFLMRKPKPFQRTDYQIPLKALQIRNSDLADELEQEVIVNGTYLNLIRRLKVNG